MGVPLEVSGRVNAQTSRFRQLEVRSDLSDYRALPSQLTLVCVHAAIGAAFSMHIVTIVRAERTLSTSGFNNVSSTCSLRLYYTCSLTACETASLLVGRSFETSMVPT